MGCFTIRHLRRILSLRYRGRRYCSLTWPLGNAHIGVLCGFWRSLHGIPFRPRLEQAICRRCIFPGCCVRLVFHRKLLVSGIPSHEGLSDHRYALHRYFGRRACTTYGHFFPTKPTPFLLVSCFILVTQDRQAIPGTTRGRPGSPPAPPAFCGYSGDGTPPGRRASPVTAPVSPDPN